MNIKTFMAMAVVALTAACNQVETDELASEVEAVETIETVETTTEVTVETVADGTAQ